jgi:acyl-CoA dehydrogenase
MSILIWLAVAIAGGILLAYQRAPLIRWTGATALLLTAIHFLGAGLSIAAWAFFAVLAIIFNIRPIRRRLISRPLLGRFQALLPPMSQTEEEAIDAGSVWWDAELFTGRPNWNKLLKIPAPVLTEEERDFLEGPTETLCRMLDDWKISSELNDLPPEVWQFIKDNRFFGMIIPRQYGGLEFSARAQSDVIVKLSSRSGAAAVTVMVPNSLGPGELLLEYGTEKQKQYYLPRLARGEEIPAFALTGPYAGSDAGSMPDAGIVCRGQFEGRETIGFRVNWSKRYITLGPICTLLGLAFKVQDPDGLLGDKVDLGITCALIPTDTPGVEIGARHMPGGAFQNGPNSGTDVFVPMDWIIGGQPQVGNGWKMLMDCLSVGRAISLPALGTSAGKLTSLVTGAYARIRRQFRTPIGKFEGIEEALARIGGNTYRMEAGRCMTAGALDAGEKPSVLSAILKYHNTEGMRKVVNDAMDVHGGRGLCRGPANYLSSAYDHVPVAITVEGANILTRSLIIFGQGAIRCHPYVLTEMRAAADPDHEQGLRDFDAALFAHAGFTISNAIRSLILGLSGGRIARVPEAGVSTLYLKKLTRMSSAFAFASDVAMLTLGGDLKRREKLSGRFADILSHLYLASAVIKHHEDAGRPPEEQPFVEWALQDSLYEIQQGFAGICDNFPVPLAGGLMRLMVLPLGLSLRKPGDRLGSKVAQLLQKPGEARQRLTNGLYYELDRNDPVGLMELTLRKVLASEPTERKLRKAMGISIEPWNYEAPIADATHAGVINDIEARALREVMELTDLAIQVDAFDDPKQSARSAAKPELATAT